MSQEEWDSEQWVIDRLVEAVHGGKPTQELGERLMQGQSDPEWWRKWESRDGGVVLPFCVLDDPNLHDWEEVCFVLEGSGAVSEERLDELTEGGELTSQELELWRDEFARTWFERDDDVEMWSLIKLTHTDGRSVFVLDSSLVRVLEEKPSVFLGAFIDPDEAIRRLTKDGYLSIGDYFERREQRKTSVNHP